MGTFQISEYIDRSPEETFDFATNFDTVPKWMPGVVRIEKMTPGPIGPGTLFRETRLMGSREHSAVIEVSEHVRPTTHVGSATCMGCLATYRYRFKPEGKGTRVEMIAEVTGKGLAKLMAPMFLMAMKKQDGDQLARLKAAIEGGPAA